MKSTFFILFAMTFAAFVQGQNPPKPGSPINTSESGALASGSIKDGNFVSNRLGISLAIPAGIHVVSAAENKVYNEAGVDLLKQGQGSNTSIEQAAKRTESLLAIAAKPIGSPLNSALEIAAAKQEPGVTASIVLAKNIMILKGSPLSLKRALGNVRIGPNTYSAADFDVSVAGINFFQRMYVIMHRGYSVVVVITYHTDNQRVEMEKTMANVVFAR